MAMNQPSTSWYLVARFCPQVGASERDAWSVLGGDRDGMMMADGRTETGPRETHSPKPLGLLSMPEASRAEAPRLNTSALMHRNKRCYRTIWRTAVCLSATQIPVGSWPNGNLHSWCKQGTRFPCLCGRADRHNLTPRSRVALEGVRFDRHWSNNRRLCHLPGNCCGLRSPCWRTTALIAPTPGSGCDCPVSDDSSGSDDDSVCRSTGSSTFAAAA